MNSDSNNSQSDRHLASNDHYEHGVNTTSYSNTDYQYYLTTHNNKYNDKYHTNEYSCQQIENSLQEEDSKDEDGSSSQYQDNQTQPSGFESRLDRIKNSDILKQYQTQNLQLYHNMMGDNSRDMSNKGLNIFSNSFDESAPSFDLRPQRNCKSSTRMMNKTQKRQAINPQIPIPILQNMSHSTGGGGSGVLTAGSLNRKQAAFNNYMKSKQQQQQNIQNNYQQTILNQMHRLNTQNSFDLKSAQDLSNRSVTMAQNNQSSQNMNGSFYALNHYLYGSTIVGGNTTKQQTANNMQSVILSAGSSMNPRNGNGAHTVNQQAMDPYTYLRWKQQKYKSCRSIQASNGGIVAPNSGHIQKQNSNTMNQFAQKKGNQTQKNNKSMCSSNGSTFGTCPTTMTVPIKSLSDVKNPQYSISFRFNDRNISTLEGISQFKNLSELDVSGNLLTQEIPELKQLLFLKKLNLSNNTITTMYSLPTNLEILNLSYNKITEINPEVTQQLKALTTLDLGNNQLTSMNGVQNLKRLKRLLVKNNHLTDISHLNDLNTIIELDLENNPIDCYEKIMTILMNKKDILVVNLKLTTIIQSVTSQEQFNQEVQLNTGDQSEAILDFLKKKLKLYTNGCLYRSKRVYSKLRLIQQNSKRSSSNFSNGSSSCGRAPPVINTGGRLSNINNNTNNNPNNTSQSNAFSPLLNNPMSTPGQGQRISQRLEDIELVYDEILDEEEEIERKLNKIQKKKHRKAEGGIGVQPFDAEDSCDEDEDESIFDEDDIHPTMSFEDDIDELHSYRNNNLNQHENNFLNESTADFNKEIRQINQELKEQLGANDLDENGNENNQLQSLHSTQSISTNAGGNKKNPISFKLDLSKCRQQQSEEFEDDNFDATDDLIMQDGQLDIPGLQYVKVTDDSFRQFQKQQSNQQSQLNSVKASQRKQQPQQTTTEQSKQNTLRDYPPKPAQKQVFIPKLQLGILQQHNNSSSQHVNIPLKQSMVNTQQNKDAQLSSKQQQNNQQKDQKSIRSDIKQEQSVCSAKDNKPSQQTSQSQSVKQSSLQPSPKLCTNQQCITAREELKIIRAQYQDEKLKKDLQITELSSIINQIKDIFSFQDQSFTSLPNLIKDQLALQKSTECERVQLQQKFEDLNIKYDEINRWKSQYESNDYQSQLLQKCEDNEKTILKLKEQLQQFDKLQSEYNFDTTSNQNINNNIIDSDVKRSYSTQVNNEDKSQTNMASGLLNNPQYFYNDQINQILISDRKMSHEECNIENLNTRWKSKQTQHKCDIRKVKRPSSVLATGQRRSSQATIKINNLLRAENNGVNNSGFIGNFGGDLISQTNEYQSCSNIDYDQSSVHDKKNFSQTMNKKVGHYIQRLKERNSSLQERLNGSFGNASGHNSALQRESPIHLNIHAAIGNSEQMCNTNPYILSPDNLTKNHFVPQSATNQNSMHQSVSSFSNNLIKKLSSKDCPKQEQHCEYNENKDNSTKHSKTQRIHINRIQYNQIISSQQLQQQTQANKQGQGFSFFPSSQQNKSQLNSSFQNEGASSSSGQQQMMMSNRGGAGGNEQSFRDHKLSVKGQSSGNTQLNMYNRQSNNLQL